MMRVASLGEFIKIRGRMSNYVSFNAENPSWHYNLDLAKMCDNWVAEQLMLLSTWDVDVDLQRLDSSQWGDRSHIRNATHAGRQLPNNLIAEWHLPVSGVFVFDYSSGKRPPAGARALDG